MVVAYLAPSIAAVVNKKSKREILSIFLGNVFFGWTVIGWLYVGYLATRKSN